MKPAIIFSCLGLAFFAAAAPAAQPAFDAPPPPRTVVRDASVRREQYLQRVHQVIEWRADMVRRGESKEMDMAAIAANLVLHRDLDACSESVIAQMKNPGSGPFWMYPTVGVAYLGRNELSPAARAAIREAWRTTFQLRGDTENHWMMYYTSVYLMSQLYPNEAGDTWFNGKSSAENLAESRDYLVHWMDLTTARGFGEFNPPHYIAEYAIPLLYLASWAEDPAMRIRGKMMLDWLFADLANNSLHGLLRGPAARADEGTVLDRSKGMSSFFNWLLFGDTPPPDGFGGFGYYFAEAAANYHVPEVIYLVATDRSGPYLQHDLKRTRRRWRYSPVLYDTVYKTTYMTGDYAVGSDTGGMVDPIQTHAWDVTWDVPDPRGRHNLMFSLNPLASIHALQMYFCVYPDTMVHDVTSEGKPSYDKPNKVLGCSPFEKIFQNQDTVIALYDIPAGTDFPQVNGFFSKGLENVTEDKSGWIFAQGGRAYLAYRPLAPYHWEPYLGYPTGWSKTPVATGDRLLISPHLRNGTIVQAASASEFKSFADFQAAIRALPLDFKLDPVPTVTMTTLRGRRISFTYGQTPVVNGQPVDYSKWQLFAGPYLNSEKSSRKLTITHGRLRRVLDFKTLTITDSVRPAPES